MALAKREANIFIFLNKALSSTILLTPQTR